MKLYRVRFNTESAPGHKTDWSEYYVLADTAKEAYDKAHFFAEERAPVFTGTGMVVKSLELLADSEGPNAEIRQLLT